MFSVIRQSCSRRLSVRDGERTASRWDHWNPDGTGWWQNPLQKYIH